jgi:hypothetical protein
VSDPVTDAQSLLAARRMALENLKEAEEQVLVLAGWIGPYRNPRYKTWRDPMNGKDTSTHDALAQVRGDIERDWGPPKGESLLGGR